MSDIEHAIKHEIEKSLEDKDFVKKQLNEFEHNYLQREKFTQSKDLLNFTPSKAKHLRWKIFENLEDNLTRLDANFSKSGIKVVWAENDKNVIEEVTAILKKNKLSYFTADKHPVREELNLDVNLQNLNYTGIVRERWNKLYQEKIDNQVAINASAIISTVQFLCIDEGLIALPVNSPFDHLNAVDAPVRIYLAGIDQIIQSVQEASNWMKLVYSYKHFKHLHPDYTLFGGFGKDNNTKGTDYLIIFDNGRSNVLGSQEHREGLYCIDCEACTKSCSIALLNGHSDSQYISSPIKSMIAPLKNNNPQLYMLAFTNTLSNAPSDICPVGINLNKKLRLNRQLSLEKTDKPSGNKWALTFWKKAMLNPKMLNSGSTIKKLFVSMSLHKLMGKPYEHLEPAKKPFRKLYKESDFAD